MNMLQMMGGELPWLSRKRVLNWFPHAIVFLWVILGAYVRERRAITGWSRWGNNFERLAREAAKHILSAEKTSKKIILFDPDKTRANNEPIGRERLKQIAKGLA
jgi:hypothetical protein